MRWWSLSVVRDSGQGAGGEVVAVLPAMSVANSRTASATMVFSTTLGSAMESVEPHHAELELVAGEGEGRGAVAVRGVLLDRGQGGTPRSMLVRPCSLGGVVMDEGLDDLVQLVAQEDGDNGRGCLVGAQTVVVAGGGDAHAQQVGVGVDGLDEGGQEDEELQVLVGRAPGSSRFLPIGADGPVVVLAGAVDAVEGLLVQRGRPGRGGWPRASCFSMVSWLWSMARLPWSKMGASSCWAGATSLCLVLAGTPSFQSSSSTSFMKALTARADGAEVVVLELLALGRLAPKSVRPVQMRSAALLEVLLLDEEVLLLRADGGHDVLGRVVAEELAAHAWPGPRGPPWSAAAGSSCPAPRRCRRRRPWGCIGSSLS